MYKNIKRIISLTVIITSLITIEPVKYFNLGIDAYAAAFTYSNAKDGELTSLEVKSSNGKTLDLLDDYNGDKTNLTDTTSYYVRDNANDNKISVSALVKGTGYVVKLFESDRKNATGHDVGENIDIVKGKTILYLRTFTSQEAYDRAQDKEDVTSSERIYKIYIQNTESTGQDDIYLDELKIDGGDIPFDFDYLKSSYSVSVKEDEDTVEIRATPEKDDYTVEINGEKANEDNKYTRKVNLNEGKNEIKIRIQNNDIEEKIYTLNIYKGIAAPASDSNVLNSSSSTEANINNSKNIKANQWVQVNDSWQYNDATGNPIKNTWFYDKSNGNSYYLQANGALAIGWFNNNGQWYYSNIFGVKQTGWQNISGEWYYLNSNGVMQTGWFKDGNEKYYYLQGSGAMAKNTTIGGYKLGSDGAWIK